MLFDTVIFAVYKVNSFLKNSLFFMYLNHVELNMFFFFSDAMFMVV